MKQRTRKCAVKSCRKPFTPYRGFENWCSPECGALIALDKKEKQEAKQARLEARQAADERKSLRQRKEALKTRSDWIKEAQREFNAYIRLRDAGKPCICCGKPLGEDAIGGGYDCGHYRSVGSAPHLRFDERNAHAQRKQCNRYGAGRAVDYRVGLIARLGVSVVDELESDQSVKKWTINDLKAIRDHYRQKLKAINKD